MHQKLGIIIVFFVLLLGTYGPKIGVIDVSFITYACLIFLFIVSTILSNNIDKNIFNITICLLCLSIYSFLITQNIVSHIALEIFKTGIFVLAAGYILVLQRYYQITQQKMVDIICIVIFFGAIQPIIFMLFPELRFEVFSTIDVHLYNDVRDLTDITRLARFSDISIGGSTASLLFAMGLGFYLTSELFMRHNAAMRAMFVVVLIFGTALVGRTGLLASIFFFIVANLSYLSGYKKYVKNLSKTYIVLGLLFLISMVTFYDKIIEVYTNNAVILVWAIEFMFSGKGLNTDSSSVLMSHYSYFPIEEISLFGSGEDFFFTVRGNFIDPFVLRYILHGGIVSIIILLIFIFYILSFLILAHGSLTKENFIRLTILLFIFVIGNLKESFLGDSRGAIFIFAVLMLIILDKHNRPLDARS